MDWDKLRVFHAVAEAGSFTHAGEELHLSQSAVSRQVSALEESLKVPLFHRHARGLILTEQGELLFRTAHDVFAKLAMTEAQIADYKDSAQGSLKVTTTVAFGYASCSQLCSSGNAALMPKAMKMNSTPGSERSVKVMLSMRASGGASERMAARNRSNRSGSAQASISTPSPSLRTDPKMPWSFARRQTWGRKPTPCANSIGISCPR